MIPHEVDYAAPASAEDAVALLAQDGARALAGGTWVVPELGSGAARASVVVDLRRAGLRAIDADGAEVRIGATATYADLLGSAVVRERLPLLHEMAGQITGGWAIREQGTVGGSLVAARPSSDAPAVLVALGAVAEIVGPGGTRTAPAAELLAGPMRTALAPGELLTGLRIPVQEDAHGYCKLKRGASSWPIATAAALARDGAVTRLVLGAVAGTPLVVDPGAAVEVAEPWEDELAPASYRAAVAGAIAGRAMRQATGG